MDQDFVKMAGELIAKVSPGFDDSPLMGFMDLFSEAGMHLEYLSPHKDLRTLQS